MDITLLNGKWALRSINDKTIPQTPEIYFQIKGDAITGFDGCNHFGGSLKEPTRMRRTQRACLSETPEFPLDLANPLPQLDSATLKGEELLMPLTGDRGRAVFRRA